MCPHNNYVCYVCSMYITNLTTINIIYIIWKHHIICACVSGVILCPDFYIFHELYYVTLMLVLCHYVYYAHYVYYVYSVICTLFYVLCTHNAHNYLR